MKTVLITGGSSGIGFEISKYFANDGYQLLWVSKLEEELKDAKALLEKEIKDVKIQYLQKDLTEENGANEVFNWAKKIGTIDVVINNAGFGTHGIFYEMPLEKELAMIQLNVMTLVKMTHLFLNEMTKRNSGTIINISSNSSFQPVPRMTTYSSTKAFVTHFSRGLQEELEIKKSKVKVVTVCPSAISDTAFKKELGGKEIKTFDGIVTTTTKEVGKDVWKGFQKGKTFILTGAKFRALHKVRNFIPYAIQQYLVRKETETVNSK